MTPIFLQAFDKVIGHEGGLSMDPDDAGNWTSGKIGIGELKGTKYGISAASYPQLDIANLTLDEAKEIYWSDWWVKYGFDKIQHTAVSILVFDFAVNFGHSEAMQLLQIAASMLSYTRLKIDGAMGERTADAISRCGPKDLINGIRIAAAARYDAISDLNSRTRHNRDGWLNRAFGFQ